MKSQVTAAVILLLAALVTWALVQAQQPQIQKQGVAATSEPKSIPTPAAAVAMAAQDIATLPPGDREFQRYFFSTDTSKEFHACFSYAINSVSHSSTPLSPLAVGEGWLVRVDLRQLWPRTEDYEKYLPILEALGDEDPFFHEPGGTRTVTKTVKKKVPARPYKAKGTDGVERTYNYRLEDEEVTETVPGAVTALHLMGKMGDQQPIRVLEEATQSAAPIFRADWFIVQVTGPRYYAFRGLQPSSGGKTAEQLWYESLGADPERMAELRADQRLVKWRSGLNGRPMAAEYCFAAGTRPSVGPAIVAVARYYKEGRIDPLRHPVKNLMTYQADGSMGIGVLPNGMLSFAMFDQFGNLMQAAPQSLATDRTAPATQVPKLQTMISCVRCHGATGMWMDATNDFNAMAKSGLHVFGDTSGTTDQFSVVDRIRGLYSGEIDDALKMVRQTHAAAVSGFTDVDVATIAAKLAMIWEEYQDPVTPQTACRELGISIAAQGATPQYQKMLPMLKAEDRGPVPESAALGALRAGLSISREDWNQEYGDAMLRVQTTEGGAP